MLLALVKRVVISTLRLFPSREDRRSLLGILRSVQGPVQARKSCIASRIFEEDGSDEAVLYLEHWDSEPDYNQHVSSELYRRILLTLELSRKAPEIQIHFISATKGMEFIEHLRTKPDEISN